MTHEPDISARGSAQTRTASTRVDEPAIARDPVGPAPGDTVGRYRLVRPLGEGGFGTVWRAEQTEPVVREVALKLIKAGMDSRAVLARFEGERQALAVMDHECIARVYDGGATDRGLPYFVMELVEGEPITDFCDRHRLGIEARLRLFVRVCQAVQHAHTKGVIHRDLKPSNILVFMDGDGEPQPRVIDFGIAKAMHEDTGRRTMFTQQGQLVGTPEYMSPEQADPGATDIDTRTDVYALGVVLYELLTGRRPFNPGTLRAAGIAEIQRIIREVDPPRPSTRIGTPHGPGEGFAAAPDPDRAAADRGTRVAHLRATLRRDLDWVVMRCLEKQRERRYASPAQVAEELRRYMAYEPVEAGPPSAAYRASKFVRRHRVGVGVCSLMLATLAIGGAGASAGLLAAVRANADLREQTRATQRELSRASEVKSVVSEMLLSVQPETAELADISLMLNILEGAERRLESGAVTDPLIRAELHLLVGRAFLSIGRVEDSRRHLPLARSIREDHLGRDHPDTLISRTYEARLMFEAGDVEGAARAYEGILGDRRRVLGEDHPLTAAAMHNLAGAFGELGRPDEAERLALAAIEIARALGDDHATDRMVYESGLGITYADLGRYSQSEAVFRSLLDESTRVLGPTDPITINAMHELGIAVLLQGRRGPAIEILQEELRLCHRVYGPVHPSTIASCDQLGETLLGGGRYSEAEALLRDRIDLALRELDADHPSVQRLLVRIDRLYERWGTAGENAEAGAARTRWQHVSDASAQGQSPRPLPDAIASSPTGRDP